MVKKSREDNIEQASFQFDKEVASLPTFKGFSASTSAAGIIGNWQITNWSVITTGGQGFDINKGVYTVPETGLYEILATITYSTATTTTSLTGDAPKITIQRSRASNVLLAGNFPVFDVNINNVSLRTILRSATITLEGNFNLTVGDQISMQYYAGGLTSAVDFQGFNSQGIFWSIHRVQITENTD